MGELLDIREFSKQLGLSIATVSQAISGHGRVAESTRQHVLKMMGELGYVPNPQARGLATGRSHMIALYYTYPPVLSDMFTVEMVRSIQSALQKHGYALLMDAGGIGDEHVSLMAGWIQNRAVDGVIWFRDAGKVPQFMQDALDGGMPVVSIGQPSDSKSPMGWVHWGVEHGVKQVVQAIVDAGHRVVGYLTLYEHDVVFDVFRTQLLLAGINIQPQHVAICRNTSAEIAMSAAELLLQQPDRPTVVFCRKDLLAMALLSAAKRMGIKVPDDLSIIGHDNLDFIQMADPPLSALSLDCGEMGVAAVTALLALQQTPDTPPQSTTIDAKLVLRGSFGLAPRP